MLQSGADGLFLDITGAAAAFSAGEERLLADLQRRLGSFGLYPRLAVAGTAGQHWACPLRQPRSDHILHRGADRKVTRRPAAGRLAASWKSVTVLPPGFRRCGELIGSTTRPCSVPASIPHFCSRLDQALAVHPSRSFSSCAATHLPRQEQLLEPILQQEHVLEAARCLP